MFRSCQKEEVDGGEEKVEGEDAEFQFLMSIAKNSHSKKSVMLRSQAPQ